MQVRRFETGSDYEFWVNNLAFNIDVISILVFEGEIVITFKRK
jgi:hypothetical protein